MKYFGNYFEYQIRVSQVMGRKLEWPNATNAKEWLDRIENELSPENLHCDGELRGAQVRVKERELLDAQKYMRQTFPNLVSTQDQFLGRNYFSAYHVAITAAKRERTAQRTARLDAAVQNGFVPGARVLISNGVRGVIVKINRTRVKVKGEDQKMWSVPPRCMTLLKVR
jgi:hypothetical protein